MTPSRRALIVGETPSLGRSIADLLEAWSVPSRFVPDVSVEGPIATLAERFPVMVVASNGPFSTTARRWLQGEFPGIALVVVGSRDPALTGVASVHRVELPLVPARLVATVRDLISFPSPPT